MSIEIELSHDPVVFENLKEEWYTLQDQSTTDSLFTTWDWMWLWWNEIDAKDGKLWLITARDVGNNELVGIAPMVLLKMRAHGFSWRQLEFISSRSPMDHWDFIIKKGLEDEAVPLILDKLLENEDKWDTLKLRNILETSPNLPHIRAYHNAWTETNGHIAPYLPLPDDWDTLQASLNKRKRKNLRRYQRAVESEFGDNWEFGIVHDDWDKINHYMDALVEFHQAQWEEMGHEGAFGDPMMKSFYDEMLECFFKNGWLYLYYIRLGDDVASVTLNFVYRGRAYDFVGGNNSELLDFSPGHLITQGILKNDMAMGLREHDFMWGDENYKFRWGARPRVDRTLTYRSSSHVQLAKHAIDLARTGRDLLRDIAAQRGKPDKE